MFQPLHIVFGARVAETSLCSNKRAIFAVWVVSSEKPSFSVQLEGGSSADSAKTRAQNLMPCNFAVRYLTQFMYSWLEERLSIQSVSDDILSKFVPAHVNIFYCFGGLVLTSFLVQAASGFALTIFYRPTVVEAFTSVEFIITSVYNGSIIRSIHRWSSGLMFLMILLHICRVYLTGGFKKPRELTWITGLLLALITISYGVTGYSLPWDQVGFWACKIVTAVPEAFDELIPGLGSNLVLVLRAGFSVGQATLTRLYSIHTFVLPVATLVLLLIHFILLRKQGISGPL